MAAPRPLLPCLLAACLPWAAPAAAAPPVTIYRCTDARGHESLRDSPCRKGEKQQTRSMLRPTDPSPARRARSAASGAPAPDAPRTRVVYLAPPRPLYECVSPEGARYTSDTDAGNPRWLPAWTVGAWPSGGWDGGGWRLEAGNGSTQVRIGREVPGYVLAPVYAGGMWVRDECHALPPARVCEYLRDERYALDRRYNSALQGERASISTRQRDIDARLANDCGDTP